LLILSMDFLFSVSLFFHSSSSPKMLDCASLSSFLSVENKIINVRHFLFFIDSGIYLFLIIFKASHIFSEFYFHFVQNNFKFL
jgi:hypothetical protein